MSLTMDPITETYDEREMPELRFDFRSDEIERLAKNAISAIRAMDDHCDGIDAARKRHALGCVRSLEEFAMTLAGE